MAPARAERSESRAQSSPCPSENEVLALVRGAASPDSADGLREHLDGCSTCQELFAVLFDGTAASPDLLDSGARSSRRGTVVLEAGAMLGKYCVRRVVGAGAMGIVYLAEDPNLHRAVAIKVLRNQKEEASSRLLREAQALARISHPNVIVVHEVGTVDDQVFMAMEFVEGSSLTTWLETEPRSTADILSTFLQAGRGLVVAHAADLVHRDFKPDNVLVGKDSRVRVVDFGLAREDVTLSEQDGDRSEARDSDAATLMTLTQTGAFIGTPAYMAPEQYDGKRADARSDQFSFAVALFEALYGRRPYDGKNLHDLAVAVRSGNVTMPKTTRRVPRHVDEALLRALSVDPTKRFPSMAAMLEALDAKHAPRGRGQVVGLALVAFALVGAATAYAVTRPSVTPSTTKQGPVRTASASTSGAATALPSAIPSPETSSPAAATSAAATAAPISTHVPATMSARKAVPAVPTAKATRDLFDTTR